MYACMFVFVCVSIWYAYHVCMHVLVCSYEADEKALVKACEDVGDALVKACEDVGDARVRLW